LRRSTAGLLADLVQRDPERMAKAVELGLVRREWLEHPGEEAVTAARPAEVLERWLERAVEQRPSTLAALGLSTIQILSSDAEDEAPEGVPETLTITFIDLEGFTASPRRKVTSRPADCSQSTSASSGRSSAAGAAGPSSTSATGSCSPFRVRRQLSWPASSWSRRGPSRFDYVSACTLARCS